MKHISVKVYSESGMVLTACAPDEVSAVYHGEYKPGDRIALGISELNRHYVLTPCPRRWSMYARRT